MPFSIRRPGTGTTRGRAFFPHPNRQRQLPYPVVAGTGAATCLCCTRLFLRRRGRAVAIGATASRFPAGNFPCCASPAGGRQHGAGGPCCSTGPANLVGSPGAAGQIPLPLTAYVWGVSCHAAGRFHRGGGFSFSLCSRSPWRARQKPLIAGIACNGAALHVFCVVSHVTHSGKRPVAYLPAGRHFFKEYPHAPR